MSLGDRHPQTKKCVFRSFVNKRQTNANEKTKKTKYTNDFLKLIFLKKISFSLRFMIKKVILLKSDAY